VGFTTLSVEKRVKDELNVRQHSVNVARRTLRSSASKVNMLRFLAAGGKSEVGKRVISHLYLQ